VNIQKGSLYLGGGKQKKKNDRTNNVIEEQKKTVDRLNNVIDELKQVDIDVEQRRRESAK